MLLENEYYKNALKLKDGEPLTKRFIEENDIYNYQDITDPEKSNYYKEQLAKMYGLDVNASDINEQLKNKKIVVPKETSRLYQYAKNSETLEKWILDNYDKIQKGEIYDDRITFPLKWNQVANSQNRGMYTTIHNANMKNMKVNPDGSISGRLVDPYNFEKWQYDNSFNLKNIITHINNAAYKQQKANKLEPYFIDMPISISKDEFNKIKTKYNKK